MSLELHLRLAGIALIALALLHAAFPKRFGWREELERLSLLNRQIFQVHTFLIATVLVLFGALSALHAKDLLGGGPLARSLLLGFVVFWALRLLVQLFVYDPALWRGQRFNTLMHVCFTAFWSYLVAVYACALWLR